jgi:hypothetical protein
LPRGGYALTVVPGPGRVSIRTPPQVIGDSEHLRQPKTSSLAGLLRCKDGSNTLSCHTRVGCTDGALEQPPRPANDPTEIDRFRGHTLSPRESKKLRRELPTPQQLEEGMVAYHFDRFGSADEIVLRLNEHPRRGPKEILMQVWVSSLYYRELIVSERASALWTRTWCDSQIGVTQRSLPDDDHRFPGPRV